MELYSSSNNNNVSLLARAAAELESLRTAVNTQQQQQQQHRRQHHQQQQSVVVSAKFPTACYALVRRIPGNAQCVDCGGPHPEWASTTYGCLLCMHCCGRHRSYGVQTSYTKSIHLDDWNYHQVLAMLEGGNGQLQSFFARHQMDSNTSFNRDMISQRYRTKAAKFYKVHLAKHVDDVRSRGIYQGREANRIPSSSSIRRAQQQHSGGANDEEARTCQHRHHHYRRTTSTTTTIDANSDDDNSEKSTTMMRMTNSSSSAASTAGVVPIVAAACC